MWGGQLTFDKAYLVAGAYGVKIVAPVMMALVVCEEGTILFDTGLHSGGLEDPLGTWGERMVNLFPADMKKEDDVQNRLREIGFSLDDIDYVANSHLHWDHTGGNRLFSDSKILVQRAEYRFACFPDSFAQASFPKNHFDHPTLNYELVEGDTKIFEGVHLIFSSGHTPGHQSLLVKLKKAGTVILPGDAIPLRENLEKRLLPGPVWDANAAYYSILKLNDIAERENGQIFFTHDLEFIEGLKKSPAFYE
jgi:N-acyl homoserine lactone hydrolase